VKVLVAKDRPTEALLLQQIMERVGHEVTVASNGRDVWNLVQSGDAELLICDSMMPALDGVELCRRIRVTDLGRYLYMILLTSRTRRDDRLAGLRAGADDFLADPVDADELVARLEIAGRIMALHERLARQNARLDELAMTDELTGIRNRRRFQEDLDAHISMSMRHGLPLSLVMLDLDHFKQYNDAFGQPSGDDVLRAVTATLCAEVRDHDVVARYGGEEFVALLPSTGADAAIVVAERLRSAVQSRPWPLRVVTLSYGIATAFPVSTDGAVSLIDQADQALQRSKQAGRNQGSHYRGGDPVPSEPSITALPHHNPSS
jgi:two-component system cell cycle response regulator